MNISSERRTQMRFTDRPEAIVNGRNGRTNLVSEEVLKMILETRKNGKAVLIEDIGRRTPPRFAVSLYYFFRHHGLSMKYRIRGESVLVWLKGAEEEKRDATKMPRMWSRDEFDDNKQKVSEVRRNEEPEEQPLNKDLRAWIKGDVETSERVDEGPIPPTPANAGEWSEPAPTGTEKNSSEKTDL